MKEMERERYGGEREGGRERERERQREDGERKHNCQTCLQTVLLQLEAQAAQQKQTNRIITPPPPPQAVGRIDWACG